MKIGMAAPVALDMLAHLVRDGGSLPRNQGFPLMSMMVEGLLDKGHHVSVFTVQDALKEPMTFKGDRLTLHLGRCRPRARDRALDFFAMERSDMVSAMKRDPCDLVHAHWTYEFALAALDSGLPCLVTAHDAPLAVLKFFRFHPYRLLRALMSVGVSRRVSHLSAVSPYVAEHFNKTMRCPCPALVVPNGVSERLVALGAKGRESRRETVTFASILTGWGARKNGRVLIEAFQEVRKVLPSSRLFMFGYGHGPGEAAEVWARAHHLAEGISFQGQWDYWKMQEKLCAEVDVLVHPSREESFGMAVAESMAMGIPAIAGRGSGAIPWVMDGGRGGLLADVNDREALGEAMILLAKNAPLRESLSREAREMMAVRFSLSSVLEDYESLYGRITAKRGSSEIPRTAHPSPPDFQPGLQG